MKHCCIHCGEPIAGEFSAGTALTCPACGKSTQIPGGTARANRLATDDKAPTSAGMGFKGRDIAIVALALLLLGLLALLFLRPDQPARRWIFGDLGAKQGVPSDNPESNSGPSGSPNRPVTGGGILPAINPISGAPLTSIPSGVSTAGTSAGSSDTSTESLVVQGGRIGASTAVPNPGQALRQFTQNALPLDPAQPGGGTLQDLPNQSSSGLVTSSTRQPVTAGSAVSSVPPPGSSITTGPSASGGSPANPVVPGDIAAAEAHPAAGATGNASSPPAPAQTPPASSTSRANPNPQLSNPGSSNPGTPNPPAAQPPSPGASALSQNSRLQAPRAITASPQTVATETPAEPRSSTPRGSSSLSSDPSLAPAATEEAAKQSTADLVGLVKTQPDGNTGEGKLSSADVVQKALETQNSQNGQGAPASPSAGSSPAQNSQSANGSSSPSSRSPPGTPASPQGTGSNPGDLALASTPGAAGPLTTVPGGKAESQTAVVHPFDPQHGSNVVFVIDDSRSMRGAKSMVARRELLSTLEQLGPNKSFYIIFFSSKPEAMQGGKPLLATPANIESITNWLFAVECHPGSDPLEALLDGLKMRPDTMWLLSDGKFDKKVADKIRYANEHFHAQIHTIGFYSTEGGPVLKQIAEENGGTYHFVPPP